MGFCIQARAKHIPLIILMVLFSCVVLLPIRTNAAINPQINFQGKLTNPDSTNVSNGNYSIRFRIYNHVSNDAANTCAANSCLWEETQATVSVTDGIFRVALGSGTALPGSVDFNTAGLYLGVKVGADAEMTPRVQFTAAPYAFNSDKLGGISSSGLVQLGISAAQADSTNNSSIFINKTATGNILQLQASASNIVTLTNTGIFTLAGSLNTSGGSVAFSANAASSLTTSSGALTITSAAAATWSTTVGNLTVQAGSGTVSLGSSTILSAAAGLSINSSTTNAITLDSGTTGAVNIGNNANAKTITIGNTTGATVIATFVGGGTNVFNIQGASSAIYMQLDTTNSRFYIGNPTADATGLLLVLDSKNTAGDPTGINGGKYYNSNVNQFRCFQNSIWVNCGNEFNTITKTTDQQATISSTVFQNDTVLLFAVNANTTYVFDAWIPVDDSNATADLKYTFTTPAAATMSILSSYYASATTTVQCNIVASAQVCANTTVNRADHFIQIKGMVTVAGTAGNVQFQFAQNASTAVLFPVIKKGATLSWHQSN